MRKSARAIICTQFTLCIEYIHPAEWVLYRRIQAEMLISWSTNTQMRQHQLFDLSGCFFPSSRFVYVCVCVCVSVWNSMGETMIVRQQCGVSAIVRWMSSEYFLKTTQKHMSARKDAHSFPLSPSYLSVFLFCSSFDSGILYIQCNPNRWFTSCKAEIHPQMENCNDITTCSRRIWL